MTEAKMLLIPLILILFLAVIVVAIVVGIYNRLVTNRNRYQNAYAQIDVQLKRRYDLIPNLVETAKGYIAHERGTLEAVTQARTAAVGAAQAAAARPGDPGAMQALAGAEGTLTAALGRLFAVVEAYPNLKANETMSKLMEELTSTENRIAFSRQAYNDTVQAYNISRESFPAVLLAGMFGFNPASLLESTESPEERKAPKVSFTR
jgi:LemA protein